MVPGFLYAVYKIPLSPARERARVRGPKHVTAKHTGIIEKADRIYHKEHQGCSGRHSAIV